jgi:hypothetical protein
MQKEATDELVRVERHDLLGVFSRVVLVTEAHDGVVDLYEPMVRNGHPVGVACQVLEDPERIAEGRLGMDDPVDFRYALEEAPEGLGPDEGMKVAMKREFTAPEGDSDERQELAAKDAAEHADRQQEGLVPPGLSRGDPSGAILGETSFGNEAMNVGMVVECLSPGMEDGEEAEAGSEMCGISADLEQCLGGGSEEEIVDDALVLKSDRAEVLRQGEYDVEVSARKKIPLAIGEPAGLGRGLTFGAVAVATRVVLDDLVAAPIAAPLVSSLGGGTARHQIPQDLSLLPGEGVAHRVEIA